MFTELPNIAYVRIGDKLHFGYKNEDPFRNLKWKQNSRKIPVRVKKYQKLQENRVNFIEVDIENESGLLPIVTSSEIEVKAGEYLGEVRGNNLYEQLFISDGKRLSITMDMLNIDDFVGTYDCNRLLDLINEFRDCFALNIHELGCTDIMKVNILDNNQPVRAKPYRCNFEDRKIIKDIVDEWRDCGIVRDTTSSYASPVILVPKSSGEKRLVVDFRKLNSQTVVKNFPIPHMDDCFQILTGCKIFCTLDLMSGYLQIPLDEESKAKTAFITPDGTAEFQRLCFGLVNAPFEFSKLMNLVLGSLRNTIVVSYLDDILIGAQDWTDMLYRLRQVFSAVKDAKLTFRLNKCEFGKKCVKFLGFQLSADGLQPGAGLCIKHPEPYYGKRIGKLNNFAHGIKGMVYAVDESTIFIKGFSYDGTGPDAFFWVGNTARPSPEGTIIPYPEEYLEKEPPVLRAYNNTDIILRLPMRIRDIRWLSVWCRRFTVDFGEVFIPPNLDVPKPRILPEFKRLAHSLRSDNISILDAKTFYIPNLHYDGAGPDAYFWVGNGSEPTAFGIKVPNEMGSLEPLRGYQGEDIEIQLPGSLTVYDIDWLSVWCVQYRHNFGHVLIPKDLDVPPALGQTKISPAWWYKPTSTTPRTTAPTNCREFLDKRLQVRWKLEDDYVEITLSAKMGEDQYVAFGLSGSPHKPQMAGGDVIVAYYNSDDQTFHADDYFMSHTTQCDGKKGVCPDERIGGRNDVTLLSGYRENGITTVKFRRPLKTNEAVNDQPIPAQGEVSVIAAFGPLNARKEANAHTMTDKTMEDVRIDFSTYDDHNCTISLDELANSNGIKAWPPATIIGENSITARIGPSGGKRGYTKITGLPAWGIAWYLNDLLIPELTVERGQTYTFIVEGGNDRDNPARYHPFYITDSWEGGFEQKSGEEREKQTIYAGVEFDQDGYPYPTAVGRYCEWTHKDVDRSSEKETFKDFMETLKLECDEGKPAYLNWTVPMDAPDLLYYQCYTHNNLGWKIHVVDPGYISEHNSGSESSYDTDGDQLFLSLVTITLALFLKFRNAIF